MRTRCLAVLALALTGCAANLSQTFYDRGGQASGGVVTYLADGAGFIVEKRHADAMEKAQAFCGTRRMVVREAGGYQTAFVQNVTDTHTAYHQGNVYATGGGSANYNGTTTYQTTRQVATPVNHAAIAFECVDEAAQL